jgi:hypothetical protein
MCSQKLHLGTPKLEAMATSQFSHVAWYWIRSVCCPWCMQVSHNWTQKCPKPVNQHQNLQSLFNRLIQNSTWTFFKANLCVVCHLSFPEKDGLWRNYHPTLPHGKHPTGSHTHMLVMSECRRFQAALRQTWRMRRVPQILGTDIATVSTGTHVLPRLQ